MGCAHRHLFRGPPQVPEHSDACHWPRASPPSRRSASRVAADGLPYVAQDRPNAKRRRWTAGLRGAVGKRRSARLWERLTRIFPAADEVSCSFRRRSPKGRLFLVSPHRNGRGRMQPSENAPRSRAVSIGGGFARQRAFEFGGEGFANTALVNGQRSTLFAGPGSCRN